MFSFKTFEGFFEDIRKVVVNMRQELFFIRNSNVKKLLLVLMKLKNQKVT